VILATVKISKDPSKKNNIETSQKIRFHKLYQHVIHTSFFNVGTPVAKITILTVVDRG